MRDIGLAFTLLLEALKNVILTFAALFPIINPLGVAPIFLSLTRAYPEPVRRLLARKIAIYGFLLLGGSLALGSAVLTFFGISLPIVQVAGGLVLANAGWRMLHQESSEAPEKAEAGTLEEASRQAFYPLTLPLTVGPGSISVAIAFGADIRQQSEVIRIGSIVPFIGGLAGMALVCVTLSVCLANAGRISAVLGPSGTNIVARLSAFLLLAVGIQVMWNGVSALIAPLITQIPAR
jgi:multiple antibiotic resistance protein